MTYETLVDLPDQELESHWLGITRVTLKMQNLEKHNRTQLTWLRNMDVRAGRVAKAKSFRLAAKKWREDNPESPAGEARQNPGL